jgi:hypothetical protein
MHAASRRPGLSRNSPHVSSCATAAAGRSAAWMCLSLHPAVMRPRSWIIVRRRWRKRRFLSGFGRHIHFDEWILACSCVPAMLVLRSSRLQLQRQKSALRFLPCSSSASGQTRRCVVIHAQKIGLRWRKCHHAFASRGGSRRRSPSCRSYCARREIVCRVM